MNQENIKIRPILTDMEVGETKSFPIIKLKSVRTQASELGAIYGRVYVTRMNRGTQTVDVTRNE